MRRVLCASMLLFAVGCASDDGPGALAGGDAPTTSGGGSPAVGGSGGGLSLGGTGSGGSGGSKACVAESAKAELKKQPVDLILVADTSNSMGAVTDAIESNINTKLIATLKSAALDYRVVLIAGYGDGSQMCVVAPLGGNACNPIPATPVLGPNFLHYDQSTGSGAFFKTILETYAQPDPHGFAPNGWSAFLRPEAKKVFLAFTDAESGPSMSGPSFDAELLSLTPALFGTASARDYVFHTFAGVAAKSDVTKPWLPNDPIAPSGCGHPKALPLQELSVLSGGLRYPLCQTENYDVVFQAVADDVVKNVAVSCQFPFPAPPAGETLDTDTIQVEYTKGTGGAETFKQVKSQADCTANSFYAESDGVHLCQEACAVVQSDPQASLDISYGCDVGFVK